MAELVSYNRLHELTNLNHRTIKSRLKTARITPIKIKQNAHLFDSAQALESLYLDPVKKDDYSKLLEQEKHRKLKRLNDLEEQKVAPVELLTEALEKVSDQIIPILESLPLLMKRNWPEITGDQITLVKKSIAESRNIIAAIQIDM